MDPSKFLNIGLREEFKQNTQITEIIRNGVPVKVSDYKDAVGSSHHDEYIISRLTAGQEIVLMADGRRFARSYHGGLLKESELVEIGTSSSEVMTFLAEVIVEHFDSIRLFKNFETTKDDTFSYKYIVLNTNPEFGTAYGVELISYKGKMVFRHEFLISPIED